MDAILTDFIRRTNTEPSFAQDILVSTDWDIKLALQAYSSMTRPSPPTPPKQSAEQRSVTPRQQSRPSGDSSPPCADREWRMHRAMSLSNRALVGNMHKKIREGSEDGQQEKLFGYTMNLPSFDGLPSQFTDFLFNDLIATSSLQILERAGVLNWLTKEGAQVRRLLPLATSGDGNCLLHAISLAMWGFHDRQLNLREAVHRVLTGSGGAEAEKVAASIRRRWSWQVNQQYQKAGGLVLTPEQWYEDWMDVLGSASSEERQTEGSKSSIPIYDSLEEVHVFTLAHVIRRPIIVVADRFVYNVNGEPIAPVHFGGVYLPLLIDPSDCLQTPLLLTYDSAHFCPLIRMKEAAVLMWQPESAELRSQCTNVTKTDRLKDVVPIQTPRNNFIPLQFAFDPGDEWNPVEHATRETLPKSKWQEALDAGRSGEKRALLQKYLNITDIHTTKISSRPENGAVTNPPPSSCSSLPPIGERSVVCVCLTPAEQPPYVKRMFVNYLMDKEKEYFDVIEARKNQKPEMPMRRVNSGLPSGPCRTPGCDLFGTAERDFLCSRCYAEAHQGDKSPTVSRTAPRQPVSPTVSRAALRQPVHTANHSPPTSRQALQTADSQDLPPGSTSGGQVHKIIIPTRRASKKLIAKEADGSPPINSPSTENQTKKIPKLKRRVLKRSNGEPATSVDEDDQPVDNDQPVGEAVSDQSTSSGFGSSAPPSPNDSVGPSSQTSVDSIGSTASPSGPSKLSAASRASRMQSFAYKLRTSKEKDVGESMTSICSQCGKAIPKVRLLCRDCLQARRAAFSAFTEQD